MPNSFINFVYNVAGKREVKKPRDSGQYVLLTGDARGQPSGEGIPSAPLSREENSDSSDRSPAKKLDIINKIFKAKAKNSDDEATSNSVYDNCKEYETDSSPESSNGSAKNVKKGVINRKKKRSFYDKKFRQQNKHPVLAITKSTTDKLTANKVPVPQNSGDEVENLSKTLQTQVDPMAVVTFIEDKDRILQQFDPLWVGGIQNKDKSETSITTHNQSKPIKPPRYKVNNNNDKMTLSENLSAMKIPELKVAIMEAIQENELPTEEKVFEEISKDVKNEKVLARANVSYEGLEGVFARPTIRNHVETIIEGEFSVAAASNSFNSELPKDSATPSYPEVLPVFVQPRKNPWNVWPGLFQNSLGIPARDPTIDADGLDLGAKNTLQNWLEESKPVDEFVFKGTDEEEKRNNKIIADFFAEKARPLNDDDVTKYSANIEISKIEIYEEDIKKYHKSLKYHRGPVDHDIIFTTVETALNFIQKLVKEREKKKKVSFLPELIEKCLKGKAKREKEKEEEERKKREKEEKKKKGALKPKMWLVFNRLSKEKVIICTPGEFYDSD